MSTYLADAVKNLSVTGPSTVFSYRRLGPQGGVPLVLLHRFRGTIDWWDPEFLDYLAADHDVIVFDNVGIGYSGGEPRDSVEGFADGAIEFIEALGLPLVDLLGWSLGGIVAQEVARRRPELVRKLVVAGSAPGGQIPDAPALSEEVVRIMTKPEADADDLLYAMPVDADGKPSGKAVALNNEITDAPTYSGKKILYLSNGKLRLLDRGTKATTTVALDPATERRVPTSTVSAT